jgi:tetratricopeptide (TPR) repeat protein
VRATAAGEGSVLNRRKYLVTVWLLCSLAGWTVIVRAQDSGYQAAMSLVQKREFDQALSLLQQILIRSPNDLKALNLMGIALSGAGKREEANEQFKKAVALDPEFVPALKNLAVNELALGKHQDARLHFEAVLKSMPRDPVCHWGLAEIAFAAREFERATAHYEQSGDLVWKDPRVTLRFATSSLEARRPEGAATLLEKIPSTLSEADANIQFQAGVLLAKLEKYDAAARRFELAREGYPDRYQAEYNLTLMLIKSGNHPAAIRAGEAMLASGHRKAEVYNLLAQAYEQSGQTKRAYDTLRTAAEIEPKDEANYLDLIALCLKHENFELSLEIAEIGTRMIPESPRLRLDRGVVLVMKGRLEEAVREFRAAGRLLPEDGLPQIAEALALIQMDKSPEAIALLRRQSERTPKDPRVFWLLGEALLRSGAPAGSDAERESISALEKSIQLDPKLPQSRVLLGKMLFRRGELPRAVEQLEKALELDPEDPAAIYQLAQALQRMGQTDRAKQLFSRFNQAKNESLQTAQRDMMRIIKAGSINLQ